MSSASIPLIRPLAIPVEHGAWGFLLEPIALGLLIAPSAHGGLIGIGMLAVFLLRHPLKLALQDWTRRRRYPRTAVCEALAAGYALVAVTALGAAFGPALLPLVIAVPFGAFQFTYDYRRQTRTLISELCGAIAPAPAVAAIVLAGGKSVELGAALAMLVLARSIPSVLYVRSILRGEARLRMIAAHAVAIGVAAFVNWIAVVPMALLFARALMPARGLRAKTIGLREVGWGAMFVIGTAASFL